MNIEEYIIPWSFWFFALFSVIALYFVLLLLKRVLDKVIILDNRQHPVQDVLNIVIQLYEPLACLFLLVGFVFINPFSHGLLITLIFVLAFNPIKNYINGRLFLLVHKLQVGHRIKINEQQGIIRKMGKFGVSLQTPDGIRFINYAKLLSEGYLLLKGEKIGKLHQLLISQNEEDQPLTASALNKLFFACPYIDWSMRPTVTADEENKSSYFVQVLVREDTHLKSLTDVIREWGYLCQTLE